MSIDVVWLVDADPPSDVGGGRGFYPASERTGAPDLTLMTRRFAAIRDVIDGEAGGAAVITLHTSPRFRDHFFAEPYAAIWRDFEAMGAAITLHPHEERADGTTLYDDFGHIESVVTRAAGQAKAIGLHIESFRSGLFAFNPALPALLDRLGLRTDLSAAQGFVEPSRNADWPALLRENDQAIVSGETRLLEIPLGWDGKGRDLGVNYLFNEKMDLGQLLRIWDAMRARRDAERGPRVVNFLTHGFGLVQDHWRKQAVDFLRRVRADGGGVISLAEARDTLTALPA
jgi:hypothetical protein